MTTGEIEKYGTGFIRIRKSLEDYPELELNFLNLSDFLRVELILKSDVTKDVGLNVGLNDGKDSIKSVRKDVRKDVRKGLSEKTLKLLKIISQNPEITVPEMELIMGVTQRTVMRYISILKYTKHIKREGGRKNGYWKILKNE